MGEFGVGEVKGAEGGAGLPSGDVPNAFSVGRGDLKRRALLMQTETTHPCVG